MKIYLYIVLALVIAFTAGRYTVPKSVDIKTTVKDDKVVDVHTVKTETETKKKDGTSVIVTTTDIVQSTKDDKITNIDKSVIAASIPKWNIGILAVEDIRNPLSGPAYAGTIAYKIIGPFTINALIITNGQFGVGIGVSF